MIPRGYDKKRECFAKFAMQIAKKPNHFQGRIVVLRGNIPG